MPNFLTPKAFKEGVVFLANEFRQLRNDIRENGKKVDLSLTPETITKLNEGDTRKFSVLTQSLANLATTTKGSNKELVRVMQDLTNAVKSKDDEKVVRALANVEKAVTANKVEIPEFDTSALVAEMQATREAVMASSERSAEMFTMLAEAITVLDKPMPKFPSEFRLNKDQLASLRHGGGGVGGSSVKPATNVTTANVAMATANTEYSYTFPANTVSWDVKLRSQGTLLLYSFETGKLPTSGDGAAYATVPQNGLQSRDNIEWSGKTIYLQTGSASQVAEIVSYQL